MTTPEAEQHEYRRDFFEYINAGSLASARVVAPLVMEWLGPKSLLDVGCGAGAWCKVWKDSGIDDVLGVDGDYVESASLLIPEETFLRKDLGASFDLSRQFDLVTSLEVGEHLPASAADTFVDNLANHGDVILFSAAVPGQGGEFHVNEQPPAYWRERFARHEYRCFDPVRPRIAGERQVEPWYRYNILMYVRGAAIERLPEAVRNTEIPEGESIPERGSLSWRTRNWVIRHLPEPAVNRLVLAKHAVVRRLNQLRTR